MYFEHNDKLAWKLMPEAVFLFLGLLRSFIEPLFVPRTVEKRSTCSLAREGPLGRAKMDGGVFE